MFKRVLTGLFTFSVGAALMALMWTDATGGCLRKIGNTCVSWGGGSGGQSAIIETREREQAIQACEIFDGSGPEGFGYGGGYLAAAPLPVSGGPVVEIRSKVFGTVKDAKGDAKCGFGTNENCDLLSLVCCKPTPAPAAVATNNDSDGAHRCRIAVVEGPQTARIEGGTGQCHTAEDCISLLRHRPGEDEDEALCQGDDSILDHATAFSFFGEVCVNPDATEPTGCQERIREFCVGVPRPGPGAFFVYQCKPV